MLDFAHRPAAISFTDVASSLVPADDKYSQGHLFVRQPCSLQIIQLVEEDAPPPREPISASMAASSYWSSEYSSSACTDDEDEDEDEDCSSYCSSDLSMEHADDPAQQSAGADSPAPVATDVRMKRILAWREDFYAQAGASLSGASLPSLKRKADSSEQGDVDSLSHSSKRWRSDTSLYSSINTSVTSLGMHSCPACDAFFDTTQGLRQHGLDAESSNAVCSAAVAYEFE